MSGLAAGFDMTSQAGLKAWQAHVEKHDLRVPVENMPRTAPQYKAPAKQRAMHKAKKAKRKAQRAARNKNRSR